jgi:hypothetical protein
MSVLEERIHASRHTTRPRFTEHCGCDKCNAARQEGVEAEMVVMVVK